MQKKVQEVNSFTKYEFLSEFIWTILFFNGSQNHFVLNTGMLYIKGIYDENDNYMIYHIFQTFQKGKITFSVSTFKDGVWTYEKYDCFYANMYVFITICIVLNDNVIRDIAILKLLNLYKCELWKVFIWM